MLNAVFNSDIFPDKKGAYLVGGSVRDYLLGLNPLDYDIAVSSSPRAFAENLAGRLSGRIVHMGKKGKESFRVIAGKWVFDISALKGDCIETDLKLRDFSINAMAYSISTGQLIDDQNGRIDLLKKSVRMVSESAFKDDPVRLLRAFRIAANLDFTIEPQTLSIIRKDSSLLMTCACERIREEFLGMLKSSRSYSFLEQMADTGLLFNLIPPLKDLSQCAQNRHHAYDVFSHTLKAYFHMENVLNHLSDMGNESGIRLQDLISNREKPMMKFAALLHDIGKPLTQSVDEDGNIHFYGHGMKSADMAKIISRNLRLSNRDIDFVDCIIRNHDRPLHLFKLQSQNQLTAKALTRFFLNCGGRTPNILLHGIADYRGKTPDPETQFDRFAMDIIRTYDVQHRPKLAETPLLNGKDLIRILGLSPSSLFKRILESVENARLAGQIHTKQEALEIANIFLHNRKGSNP
jgi:poly(A) polymerase